MRVGGAVTRRAVLGHDRVRRRVLVNVVLVASEARVAPVGLLAAGGGDPRPNYWRRAKSSALESRVDLPSAVVPGISPGCVPDSNESPPPAEAGREARRVVVGGRCALGVSSRRAGHRRD